MKLSPESNGKIRSASTSQLWFGSPKGLWRLGQFHTRPCLLPEPTTGRSPSAAPPLYSGERQRLCVVSVLTSPAGPALQPRPSPAGLDRGAGSAGQRAARAAEEVGCFPEPCWAGRRGSGLAGLPTPGQDRATCGCKCGGMREDPGPRAHSHTLQEAGGPASAPCRAPLLRPGWQATTGWQVTVTSLAPASQKALR